MVFKALVKCFLYCGWGVVDVMMWWCAYDVLCVLLRRLGGDLQLVPRNGKTVLEACNLGLLLKDELLLLEGLWSDGV